MSRRLPTPALWLLLLLSLPPAAAGELEDGYAAFAAGNVELARELFGKARKEDATAAMAYRGLALLAAKGDEKAESTLQSAKGSAPGRVGLGFLALTRATATPSLDYTQLESAESWFKQALELDPALPLAHAGAGLCALLRDDIPGAVAELLVAQKAEPGNTVVREGLAEARRRWVEALVAAVSTPSEPPAAILKPGALPLDSLPLDNAFRSAMGTWFQAAARSGARAEAEGALRGAKPLATWLAGQKDTCGQGIAELWAARLHLRLDGNVAAKSLAAAGRERMVSCSDAALKKAWGAVTEAEVLLHFGDLSGAEKAARAALEIYEMEALVGGRAEAGLALAEALLAQGRFSDAEAALKTATPLYTQIGDHYGEIEAALLLSRLQLAKGDAKAARETAEKAEKSAETLEWDPGLGRAMTASGRAAAVAGDSGAALTKLDAASRLQLETGDDVGRIATLGAWGDLYVGMGDLTKARGRYAEALTTLQAASDPWNEGHLLLSIAAVDLTVGEYGRVGDGLGRATTLLGEVGDAAGLAEAGLYRGRLLLAQGDIRGAEPAFEEARQRYEKLGDAGGRDAILAETALLDRWRADYAAAGIQIPAPPSADALLKLLPLYQAVAPAAGAAVPKPPADAAGKAAALRTMGTVAAARNDLLRARDFLLRALLLLPSNDYPSRAAALASLGTVQRRLGEYAASESAWRAAIAYQSSPGLETARSYSSLGLAATLRLSGDPARGAATAEEVLKEAESRKDDALKIQALLELGRSSTAAGSQARAIAVLQEAAAAAELQKDVPTRILAASLLAMAQGPGVPSERDLVFSLAQSDQLGDPTLQLLTRLVWLRTGPPAGLTPEVAARQLPKLPDLLDALRAGGALPDGFPAVSAFRQELLRAALALFDGGQADAAFRVLSSAELQGEGEADWLELRARKSAAAAARKDVISNDVAVASLGDAFDRLEVADGLTEAAIPAVAAGKLSGGPAAAMLGASPRALSQVMSAYRALLPADQRVIATPSLASVQAALAAMDGRAAAGTKGGSATTTAVAAPKTVIVSWFLREKDVLAMVVSAEKVEVKAIAASPATLHDATVRVLTAMDKMGPAATRQAAAAAFPYGDLQLLYTQLFAPVAAAIPAGTRLLLVPDGPLHAIPFGALLPEPPPKKADPFALNYLLKKHPIAVLPTAAWIARPREPVEGETNDPLGVGVWLGEGAKATGFSAGIGEAGEFGTCTVGSSVPGNAAASNTAASNTAASNTAASNTTASNAAASNTSTGNSSATDACKKGPTVAGWLEMARDEYDVLLMATPGVDTALGSSLTLAPDATLWASRARRVLLYTDLVLLPGMRVDPAAPEAALGFARNLLDTRVRSAVSTLWTPDAAAMDAWLGTFAKGYVASVHDDDRSPAWKAEAAQAAALGVLGTTEANGSHPFAHPYYWAGTEVVGFGN